VKLRDLRVVVQMKRAKVPPRLSAALMLTHPITPGPDSKIKKIAREALVGTMQLRFLKTIAQVQHCHWSSLSFSLSLSHTHITLLTLATAPQTLTLIVLRSCVVLLCTATG
jgi:hypothetical protein